MTDTSTEKKIEPVNPSLTRHTVKYLKRLRRSGLHGKTVSAVARTLIHDQIKQLIRDGVLKMEFSDDPDDGEELD